jgi:hypothetical protein
MENSFIPNELINKLANVQLEILTKWANSNIYNKFNGELSFKIPWSDSVDAGATVYHKSIYTPKIIITQGMICEIYRDSFTFPIVSEQISSNSNNIETFNQMFPDHTSKFETGIPTIKEEHKSKLVKMLTSLANENKDYRLSEDIYTFRYTMFETLLTWMFFHELSHLIQMHYKLREDSKSSEAIEFYEMEQSSDDQKKDLKAQGREILADLEGLDLTIKYMNANGSFSKETAYSLLCGIGCMFYRFYGKNVRYDDDLNLAKGTHPHPVIREEFVKSFFVKVISIYLSQLEQENKLINDTNLTYITVRSSMMVGIFWSNRYHTQKGEFADFPSFMSMQSRQYDQKLQKYRQIILTSINEQIEPIINNHLVDDNVVKYLHNLDFFAE